MLAKDSLRIIVIPLIAGFVLFGLGALFQERFFVGLTGVALLAVFFSIAFFRDPTRRVGSGVVAAADGVVRDIIETETATTISTFMNVHNVHVNRAPLGGIVTQVEHHDGAHRVAFGKHLETNEHTIITISTAIGAVTVIQIAGSFARRIETYVAVGDAVEKGERIGMIRFGSRVDVSVPRQGFVPAVRTGMRIRAGSGTLGAYDGE